MKKTLCLITGIITISIISSSHALPVYYNNNIINTNNNIYNLLVDSNFKEKTNNIDSLLISTFLGGSRSDGGFNVGITSDKDGNIFVTGVTSSLDFPTTNGAYDITFNGGSDIFISKFNPDLTELLSSTFIGGSENDETNRGCISIDKNGHVLLTGITNSVDFPITNSSYDSTYSGNQDIFIMKLNNDLSSILNSTFLGGSSIDGYLCDISINTNVNGDIYVSGRTGSRNFPTTQNSYSDSYFGGSSDFFIAKFDNNISSLKTSTFFGGSRNEEWTHLFLDNDNNVFVGGFTSSSDIPTTSGAYDESFNGVEDTFVAKFNNDLNNLIACTYLGGSQYDNCYTMNIDKDGNILLGGHADYGFPITRGAFRRFSFSKTKGFISKLNGDLSNLIASTFLVGGFQGSVCMSIDSDIEGNIYAVGYTRALLFPTKNNAFDRTHNGGVDVFVSMLDRDLSTLMYSTFLGGNSDDEVGSALLVDSSGIIYVGSGTASSDFPTTSNSYDVTFNGVVDCFIAKLNCNP